MTGRAEHRPRGWSPPARMCYRSLMRAYLAQVTRSELCRFVSEDLIPEDLLRRLTREWSSPATIVLEAVLDEEDAEAVREQLAAGRHPEAGGLLLDRAVAVHPIVPDVSESCLKIDEEPRGTQLPDVADQVPLELRQRSEDGNSS